MHAGIKAGLQIIRRQHSAHTNQHVRARFSDASRRRQASWGAQGHLNAGQTTLQQGVGQRKRVVGILHDDHRNDRRGWGVVT
jgi:hypothetical protein